MKDVLLFDSSNCNKQDLWNFLNRIKIDPDLMAIDFKDEQFMVEDSSYQTLTKIVRYLTRDVFNFKIYLDTEGICFYIETDNNFWEIRGVYEIDTNEFYNQLDRQWNNDLIFDNTFPIGAIVRKYIPYGV